MKYKHKKICRFLKRHPFLVFLIVFLLIVIIFYPQYYLVSDEHHYARTAFLLSEGTTSVDSALNGYIFQERTDGRFVSKYPLGLPILMAPFMALHFNLIFLVNILLHVIAAYCFYLILRSKKINHFLASLYLFIPYFVYYSFSLFSDYTATALLVILYYLVYHEKRTYAPYLSGVIIGALFHIRPVILILVPFFFIGYVKKFFLCIKKRTFSFDKEHRAFLQTFLIACLLILPFIFSSFFGVFAQYNSQEVGNSFFIFDNLFPIQDFFLHLLYQLIILTIAIPGLVLVLPYKIKKHRAWGIIAYIVFFCFVDYTTTVTKIRSIFSIIPNVRYLLPIIALLFIDYIPMIYAGAKRIKIPCLKCVSLGLLIACILSSIFVASVYHESSLRNRELVEDLYSHTSENSLLISNGLAFLLNDFFGKRSYIGFNDYGNTQDGTFYTVIHGYNNSLEYIDEQIKQHESFLIIHKNPFVHFRESDQAKMNIILSEHPYAVILNKTYVAPFPYNSFLSSSKVVIFALKN